MIGTGESFCSNCDPCETRSEAYSYLQKHKKIICDLKLSYTRPSRAVDWKLLASETTKLSENSRSLLSSTRKYSEAEISQGNVAANLSYQMFKNNYGIYAYFVRLSFEAATESQPLQEVQRSLCLWVFWSVGLFVIVIFNFYSVHSDWISDYVINSGHF